MNPFEVKVLLMRKGLTITDIARQVSRGTKLKENSAKTMISDMIYGRRFYSALAKKIDKKFGIKFERPAHCESATKIVQKAA